MDTINKKDKEIKKMDNKIISKMISEILTKVEDDPSKENISELETILQEAYPTLV